MSTQRKTMASKRLPTKKRDMPATVGLVEDTRDELKAEIRSVRGELKSEITSLRTELKAEIASVRTELKAEIASVRTELKAEIGQLDAKVVRLDSKVEQVLVSVHRMQAIAEEQRGENRIMLEALTGFGQRLDRMETRQDAQDATLRDLARSRNQRSKSQ